MRGGTPTPEGRFEGKLYPRPKLYKGFSRYILGWSNIYADEQMKGLITSGDTDRLEVEEKIRMGKTTANKQKSP